MKVKEVIIPCTCGTFTHCEKAIYCGHCGKKLKREGYSEPEEQLIELLVRYTGKERL